MMTLLWEKQPRGSVSIRKRIGRRQDQGTSRSPVKELVDTSRPKYTPESTEAEARKKNWRAVDEETERKCIKAHIPSYAAVVVWTSLYSLLKRWPDRYRNVKHTL